MLKLVPRSVLRSRERSRSIMCEITDMMREMAIIQPCEQHGHPTLQATEVEARDHVFQLGRSMVVCGQLEATDDELRQAIDIVLADANHRCFGCELMEHT